MPDPSAAAVTITLPDAGVQRKRLPSLSLRSGVAAKRHPRTTSVYFGFTSELSHPVTTGQRVAEHQYEARCPCGARRVYLEEGNDDPMATCVNCGADTFDLTDIGELRSAGPGTT